MSSCAGVSPPLLRHCWHDEQCSGWPRSGATGSNSRGQAGVTRSRRTAGCDHAARTAPRRLSRTHLSVMKLLLIVLHGSAGCGGWSITPHMTAPRMQTPPSNSFLPGALPPYLLLCSNCCFLGRSPGLLWACAAGGSVGWLPSLPPAGPCRLCMQASWVAVLELRTSATEIKGFGCWSLLVSWALSLSLGTGWIAWGHSLRASGASIAQSRCFSGFHAVFAAWHLLRPDSDRKSRKSRDGLCLFLHGKGLWCCM